MYENNKAKQVFMHNFIWELMNNKKPNRDIGERLCFKDGNRLNITIKNLIIMSKSDKVRLSKNRNKNNKTTYRGVSYHKTRQTYRAVCYKDGKAHWCGQSKDINIAAELYNKKAIELLGDRAILNVINQ